MGMMQTVDVNAEFEKLYFGIAGDPEPVTLELLLMAAEGSHFVFGSNYHHSPANIIITKKKHFDENDKYARIRGLIYGSIYKPL